MINRLMLAIQFLTIIPVPAIMVKEEEFHKTMGWFPLAGLLVGSVTAAAYWLSAFVLPTGMAILIALLAQFLVTGGLHLDGLADTFDGCMSGRSRDRKLDIMKDSRLGTHGSVILMFLLLCKTTAYFCAAAPDRVVFMLLAPAVGKFALVLGAWGATYARKEGVGHLFIGAITYREAGFSLLLVIGFMAVYPATFLSLPIVWLTVFSFRKSMDSILGGMTGDTLGALNEISEMVFLCVLLAIVQGG